MENIRVDHRGQREAVLCQDSLQSEAGLLAALQRSDQLHLPLVEDLEVGNAGLDVVDPATLVSGGGGGSYSV